MLQHYGRPDALPPVAGYSHVVAFSGRMIAISGQVPLDEGGNLVGEGRPEAQVRQVFDNLAAALDAVGAGFDQVVKLTFYVIHMEDLPIIRSVRDEYISVATPPASTLVQVAGLVNPAFRIEIDALAAI